MPIIETTTTDPRPQFATALATATETVTAVRPDQLTNPTPCREFDVRALLGHLVHALDRITAIGQGENPFALAPREVAEDGWMRAWDEAAAAFEATWADDAALRRPSPLPWAPGTGVEVVTSYISELTVHTWDLAQATGQDPAWDDEVLAVVAASIGGMPATGRAAIFAPIKATLPPHPTGSSPGTAGSRRPDEDRGARATEPAPPFWSP